MMESPCAWWLSISSHQVRSHLGSGLRGDVPDAVSVEDAGIEAVAVPVFGAGEVAYVGKWIGHCVLSFGWSGVHSANEPLALAESGGCKTQEESARGGRRTRQRTSHGRADCSCGTLVGRRA